MSENFEKHLMSEQRPEPISESEKLEPKIEEELSPEVIEKIMAKVQDINENGTSVHSLFRLGAANFGVKEKEFLASILKDGLLGQEWHKVNTGTTNRREGWAQDARKRKKLFIFFNVVDKDLDKNFGKYKDDPDFAKGDISKVEESPWLRQANCIGIIFKTEHLRMTSTIEDQGSRLKMFGPWTGGNVAEEGYAMTYRLRPRLFQGMVFNVYRPITETDKDEPKRVWNEAQKKYDYYIEDNDIGVKERRANEISEVMVKGIKEEHWLPIYDVYGNLWWPKQMSYEEVKKFVAGKDE